MNKFPGKLKEQIMHIRRLTPEGMEKECDWSWCYDTDPDKNAGSGQVVVVPPGYIVCKCSAYFVGVTKCFGGDGEQSMVVIANALTALFESYPALRSGSYDLFFKYLIRLVKGSNNMSQLQPNSGASESA